MFREEEKRLARKSIYKNSFNGFLQKSFGCAFQSCWKGDGDREKRAEIEREIKGEKYGKEG